MSKNKNMISSKINKKFQIKIPKKIQKILELEEQDTLNFQITENNEVLLKKTDQIDIAYLKNLNLTLCEWQSEEDKEAYQEL